jgi:hypothetical protein
MPQIKTWKTRPAYFYLLEVLTKKGDLTDDDLNELLLKLEVSGKIRTSSMSRGKRRIELVQPR